MHHCTPLQLHGPCPCRRGGAQPMAAPDGASPAAWEGDSLARPDLKKIPRPRVCVCACVHSWVPITVINKTCMRPIERPAWCDGHFQGPACEIGHGR